ncbi:gamma-glutamyltransferase family protein [Bordetella genomosp. 13]|uniref:gamma-glutamyltransferase family protein n=1 Tax=Bordetella genomosp. 13 TaxID=463040 RepID=UPI0016423D13|nr:gamma-glutamyltransferase [Bordetella genomosp. 13]
MPSRPRASLYGRHHGVATGHHQATHAARLQLEAGGSLCDAMIAASAVLTVALPHATSLGGCAMALFYDAATGRLRALDGSGVAPRRAVPSAFDGVIDGRGPRSWLVPGLVRMWAAAHRAHGKLPWRSLFQPAIALAADGGAFSSELARNLSLAGPPVRGQPGFAQAFMDAGRDRLAGTPYPQAALARTLERIADQGEAGFYEGPAAAALCTFAKETGGLLEADDLLGIRAQWRDPVWQDIGGWRIGVMPPNSVGVLMLAQLHALRHEIGRPRDDRLYAQVMQARRLLPALHDRVADTRAAWPCPELPAPHPTGRTDGEDPGDTAGIVLADAQGNGLVMLQSVFQPFGSGCVDPGTGVLMNNRLGEFSLDPRRHNMLAPGKKPVHTLNPYLVLAGGRPVLYAVSPGGVSQTTTGVQYIFNALDDGLPLPQAIDLPRWSIARDGSLQCEPGFPATVVDRLRAAGITVQADSLHPFYFGSIKAVRRLPEGMLEAAADLRREACAMAW